MFYICSHKLYHAHCMDLLLEDIGKIKEFHSCINMAEKVSRFIYKHGRNHNLMRGKICGDLVRPGVTRFATSFLTLASIHRHRNSLRNMFVSDEWHQTRFPTTQEGSKSRILSFLRNIFGKIWRIDCGLHNHF
jgi:hypothetical protein